MSTNCVLLTKKQDVVYVIGCDFETNPDRLNYLGTVNGNGMVTVLDTRVAM